MTKASDNQFPKVTFAESSAPSTPSSGLAALYVKSDGIVYLKNDAGTEYDLTGAVTVPGWVSGLVGTTATNSYYWDGDDLAGFTETDVTGTTTWTEDNNLVSCLAAGMTSGDLNVVLIAKTFSIGDAWDVPVLGALPTTVAGAAMAGIVFTDGTTSAANCVAGVIQWAASVATPVGRHGTLTAATTAPWVLDANIAAPFMSYIRLKYSAANTFQVFFSPDGVTFHAFGEADISKTMTPTHVGLCVLNQDADGGIFTFGPLIKTA